MPLPTFSAPEAVAVDEEPNMPMPPATSARTTTPTTATAGCGRWFQNLAPDVLARASARRPTGET